MRSTRFYLTLAITLTLALIPACRTGAAHHDPLQSEAMLAVVRAQESAWNQGDLERYMSSGYVREPFLTFFSGGDVTRGYEPVLERYRQRYASGGREMGRLSFTELESLPYGPDTGLVRGRWRLEFLQGAPMEGLFTLLLRRTAEGWRIVHDHTSLAASR